MILTAAMPLTPAQFRELCPFLDHYSSSRIRVEIGLRTASQLLDMCADSHGIVETRFVDEMEFRRYSKDHWKVSSRFRRRAGEQNCNVLLRHATNRDQLYVLGNNYPLGSGDCLGITIPLTDNWPGTPEPTREHWFETLNGMFWVFDAERQ